MADFEAAVAEAEFAFVGTMVGAASGLPDEMGEGVLMTWEVERARDPGAPPTVGINGWSDSGANCGISFDRDQRWLVLAYEGDDGLETNSCMPNRRLDGADPEAEAVVAELITEMPDEAATTETSLEVPAPVLIAGAGVLAIMLISLLAFRGRASVA